MQPHYRALGLTLGALAISLGSVGVASFVAWTRCDGEECSVRLAISVVGLAPASLLVATMLLLLRVRMPLGRTSRGFTAASVGVASLPLTFFVLGDPLVVGGSAALLAVLIFFALTPEAAVAGARPASVTAASRLRTATPADRAIDTGSERRSRADAVAQDAAARGAAAQQRLDQLAERAEALAARTSRLSRRRPLEPPRSMNGHKPHQGRGWPPPHLIEDYMYVPSRNGDETPDGPRVGTGRV
jgi:hypothetical protein